MTRSRALYLGTQAEEASRSTMAMLAKLCVAIHAMATRSSGQHATELLLFASSLPSPVNVSDTDMSAFRGSLPPSYWRCHVG